MRRSWTTTRAVGIRTEAIGSEVIGREVAGRGATGREEIPGGEDKNRSTGKFCICGVADYGRFNLPVIFENCESNVG